MSDDGKPKKGFSFFGSIRQKLVDDLLSAAERNKNDKGEIDSEKLRQDQLSVLSKQGEQLESVAGIFSDLRTNAKALHEFAEAGARSLNEILVSVDPVPFRDFSDLDSQFGPLPKGYSYRYLAPPQYTQEETAANLANNVIRLPTSFNDAMDHHFDLSGDEIPDRSLADWLTQQPPDLYRLWSLRVLKLFGVLDRNALPGSSARTSGAGTVPTAGFQRPAAGTKFSAPTDPKVAELIRRFEACATLQYDGEVAGSDSDSRGGVYDKKDFYEKLKDMGSDACLALGSLLDHPDIGVRVSAATYLLPWAPNSALNALREAVDSWPAIDDDRVQNAAYHAQQAIWMHEDGNLRLGETPPPENQ
jgi:hypothetical protein